MSKPIIEVENLSKLYHVGDSRPKSLRHAAERWWNKYKKIKLINNSPKIQFDESQRGPKHGTFWSLKNICLKVNAGEVVGIIGKNGAGKSTLLKVLSRITEPTSGRAVLRGRVASLLEVGTGFHPDLTGRENAYLNGAILGMRKDEIEKRFDSIVSFAEVENFIDTPVKHYSSGMYVRLAFAVAAHLDPEILIVDEVLAVGDFSFQQKCLTHMKNLTRKGMTILFVSHQMSAIQTICRRAFFLEGGRVEADGPAMQIVDRYQRSFQENEEACRDPETVEMNGKVQIESFELFGEDGGKQREIKFGESPRIRIVIDAKEKINSPQINFGIRRGDGVVICNFNNWYDDFRIEALEGKCVLEGWLPPLRLTPGFYEIHVLVWPWGGGHAEGDMNGLHPYAAVQFGNFRMTGPALNEHDGVFQIPAIRWRFQSAGRTTESQEITTKSIERAFTSQNQGEK